MKEKMCVAEPVSQIFLSPPWMSGDELPLVEEAFASHYIAPCGPMVNRFERDFSRLFFFPNACALSSGTAALDLLFDFLQVGRGDTVVCSDLTFISSIGPAVHRGATPLFIDATPDSWNLSPNLLEQALSDTETPPPKAVVAVDLYGQCCDYDAIESICARYHTPLIIDAAEALGATYKGRPAGHAGLAAAFSFNGNKIITTSGGGMLASQNAEIIASARKMSQQSREPVSWYEHRRIGYNARLSNISAAIGVGQLAHLPEIITKKRTIFSWYQSLLADLPRISWMPEAAYGTSTRWLSVALIDPPHSAPASKPDEPAAHIIHLLNALATEKIEARPVWKPMHLQPVFRGTRVVTGKSSLAESLFQNGICLPSGCGLAYTDVERICDIIRTSLKEC